MSTFISKIITPIKGDNYQIHPSYPSSYIIRISFSRLMMLLRGLFVWCHKKGPLFIGKHTTIVAKKKLRTGANVTIDRYCYIDAMSIQGAKLGNNCSIGEHTTIRCVGSLQNLAMGLNVGNNVGLGTHGFFRCAGGITIGKDCWIGAKATILDGANIGNACIIAAGSVVTAGNYEDNCIYGGIPAKKIKNR